MLAHLDASTLLGVAAVITSLARLVAAWRQTRTTADPDRPTGGRLTRPVRRLLRDAP